MMLPLVLASSSQYRKSLLSKLGLTFACASPDIDESPLPNETAEALVQRLSFNKAYALADKYPNHLIIGSDQVAVLDGKILGKPHTHQRATEQLRSSSGNMVTFKTGLCLLNSATGQSQIALEEFCVEFRQLTEEQIENYLQQEKPYDCAGSFKSEGLGIVLFTKLNGRDPNTLVGLPLIQLVELLANEGIDPLNHA